ncbi:MAG: CoA-transferase subunit beta [Candidatus Melainabacteria bacterium]|nr:CoA-transferase subunit beta [Candidatus Melainabacteria bacterium]
MVLQYTDSEMMVVEASRRLADGERVLVGVGMPNLAACLALKLHAPNLVLIFESGVVGSRPQRLPLSIGDSVLAENAQVVCSMFELFNFYLQGGLVDVGFLGGAQIDCFGNINSTVIGPYAKCKVRLPGSGGACEIAIHAKRTIIMTRQDKKRFPPKVDFITSPGFLNGKNERQNLGLPGGGPREVITNLGVYEFNADQQMILAARHPGVSLNEIQSSLGWQLNISGDVPETQSPTAQELAALRELDVEGHYLGSAA